MKTVVITAVSDNCVERSIWMGDNVLMKALVTEKTAATIKEVIEDYWVSMTEPFELHVTVRDSHNKVMVGSAMTIQ